MSSDIAIKVENLGKYYPIYDRPGDVLKQLIIPPLQHLLGWHKKKYFHEYWVLKNISFEIKKGETVGIIGQNGSGKSTLLQMISGTLNPSNGHIQTHGRITALLELGSGFNPEFTGRENVYLNAAILGLSKTEIEQRFDDIVTFADIGDFIDQPVKTYSSGMLVRLAFAVQAQIMPDILIVDEALAVGDAKFQARCFECLKQLKRNGTSILLVTHSSEQIVTHCSHAMLLHEGSVLVSGEPRHVVNRYMDLLFGKERKTSLSATPSSPSSIQQPAPAEDSVLSHIHDLFATRKGYNPHEYRWGDGMASILDFRLCADDLPYPSTITSGQTISLDIAIRFHADLTHPILGITIKTKEGITVYGANSQTLQVDRFKTSGKKDTTVIAHAVFSCHLAPGDYFISLGVATQCSAEIIPHDRRYDAIHLHLLPVTTFFGVCNLDLEMTAEEAAP